MKRGKLCGAGITLYMSLVLLVMLSLIAAGFYSVRIAAGRVSMQMAAEEGLYSAFAGYDRELFDRYGLLFLDAGKGGPDWKMGPILKRIVRDAELVAVPSDGGAGLTDLCVCRHESSVTGLVLATDLGGAAFERQVCQQEKLQLSKGSLYRLREKTERDGASVRDILEQRAGITPSRADAFYVECGEDERPALPADFRNPIQAVTNLKKRGLLALVFPDVGKIPSGTIAKENLAGCRALKCGIGMRPTGWEGGSGDASSWLRRYLMDDFCCYTDDASEAGAVCQIEYGIKRRGTDRENLREVLLDLLKIREASNLLYLLTNPSKGREADLLAASMAAASLTPEAAPAVSFALKCSWAYGEAVMDLRSLVNGGKVPLVKSDADWKLELGELAGLGSVGVRTGDGDAGLSYRDYLRILLMKVDGRELLSALMDLVELNMRASGRGGFSLDCCVDAMEVELHADICGRDYSTRRAFGYDMKG
uniref:DUF5702 domain-containing protein n=1 Tax=Eubacterium cellulosolvens TaxID=29322 RepID=UPI000489F04E|nr:DUF5702 domain-containing protein [[Eubacterium] cellulosolvens]